MSIASEFARGKFTAARCHTPIVVVLKYHLELLIRYGTWEAQTHTTRLLFIAYTMPFSISVLELWVVCFGRICDPIFRHAAQLLWQTWWGNAGMATHPNALQCMRLSKCWKLLIQVREGEWFLLTMFLAASVLGLLARLLVPSFMICTLITLWCRNKGEPKLCWFVFLLCFVVWNLLSRVDCSYQSVFVSDYVNLSVLFLFVLIFAF